MAMIVDAWAQHPNALFMEQPWLATLLHWTRQQGLGALPIDATLKAMDDAGVDRAMLNAWSSPTGMLIGNEEVAALVAAHPDRFTGVAAVDLRYPVAAVRELRRAVLDLGLRALRVVPWLWIPSPRRPPLLPALRNLRGVGHPVLHPDRAHRPVVPVRTRSADLARVLRRQVDRIGMVFPSRTPCRSRYLPRR